jgi:D-alanyl-D-alanine carboxypeptidase
VDFITSDMNNSLTVDFETKAAFAWLRENAHTFGFILRYPKGKEEITGYSYEPWHYRFVGREAATEIRAAGITLEEYLSGIQ